MMAVSRQPLSEYRNSGDARRSDQFVIKRCERQIEPKRQSRYAAL
jgi:hypothetical protein